MPHVIQDVNHQKSSLEALKAQMFHLTIAMFKTLNLYYKSGKSEPLFSYFHFNPFLLKKVSSPSKTETKIIPAKVPAPPSQQPVEEAWLSWLVISREELRVRMQKKKKEEKKKKRRVPRRE